MAKKDKLIPVGEIAKKKRLPAILHFRPTHFRKMEPAEALKNWEKLVLKSVGIHVKYDSAIVYYETTCGTGQYDDCAEEDPGEQTSD